MKNSDLHFLGALLTSDVTTVHEYAKGDTDL